MVRLSELGLPFKKRVTNWHSGSRLPSSPPGTPHPHHLHVHQQQHHHHHHHPHSHQPATSNDSAQKLTDDWDWGAQDNPQEAICSLRGGGLHRETTLKPNSSGFGMGRSFMDDANDVFVSGGRGNRLRSYSDRIASGETSSSMDSADGPRTALSMPEMRSKSPQAESALRPVSPTPSKSAGIASYMKQPLPSLAETSEDLSPPETSASGGLLDGQGWVKIENPLSATSGSTEDPKPIRGVYQVPQRRLSEARAVSKLTIDTSLAPYTGRYSATAAAATAGSEALTIPDPTAAFPAAERLYAAYSDIMRFNTAFSQANGPDGIVPANELFSPWGPCIGEAGISSNLAVPIPLSEGVPVLGRIQRDRSGSCRPSNGGEQCRADTPVNPTNPPKGPSNAGYPQLAPARQSSPVRQHSGNVHPPAGAELPGRFTEAAKQHNVRIQAPPGLAQENHGQRQGQGQGEQPVPLPPPHQYQYQHQHRQQHIPSYGYHPGYQFRFTPHPASMQYRQDGFPQQSTAEIYTGTGLGDSYASYVLRAIPHTGPRFIR